MSLLLLAGLAACDRQSPPAGQANANASGEVPAGRDRKGNGASAGQGETAPFSYTLDRSKAGTPAPDFAFHNPDGGDATLQDFAGRPLLVNLWATWCAPCVAEMPTLDAVAATYGPKGLAVLTLAQDTQGKKAVDPFFAKHTLPHLTAWTDPDNRFGFAYATGLLPTTVIYDAAGKEMVRVIGSMDWNGPEAKALIVAAMAS